MKKTTNGIAKREGPRGVVKTTKQQGGRVSKPTTSANTRTPKDRQAPPRRSARKRMSSRYFDEDMITLDDAHMWSPALSRALQERYDDSGRKRTPRTLTRLMQQHRENERHRHHGLNASIREISERIPGFEDQNKETKIVKLQRIINYICHLESRIKNICDNIGFNLDYKNLFLSPHISKTPDDWKPVTKPSASPDNRHVPRKYTALTLKQHLERKMDSTDSDILPLKGPSPLNSQVLPVGSSYTDEGLPDAESGPAASPTAARSDITSNFVSSGRRFARPTDSECSPGRSDSGHSLESSVGSRAILNGLLTEVLDVPHESNRQDADLQGEALPWLPQDLAAEDISWLNAMMESASAEMDSVCQQVLELPEFLVGQTELVVPESGLNTVPQPQETDHALPVDYSEAGTIKHRENLLPSTGDGSTLKKPSATGGSHLEKPAGMNRPDVLGDGISTGGRYSKGRGQSSNRQQGAKRSEAKASRVDHRKTSWMNGFMMYSRIHRKQYIEDNPGVHTSHISRLMGQDWRKLSQAEQQPYREKARMYVDNHLLPQCMPNLKSRYPNN